MKTMKTTKNRMQLFFAAITLAVAAISVPATASGSVDPKTQPIATASAKTDSLLTLKAKKSFSGLKRTDGNLYYYKNGIAQSGWHKENGHIYYFAGYKSEAKRTAVSGLFSKDGKRFYFSEKNILQTGWQTIKGHTFYFKTSGKIGERGAAYTGVQKITGKYYAFRENGILKTKTFSENGTTYYINNSVVEAYKTGTTYYKPNGTAMTTVETEDYETLRRARAVVAEVTNASMDQNQKLLACFQWVIHHPYAIHRTFKPTADWPSIYANDHFVRGRGDCHADGAAFAYLARVLGYTNVYVCVDCDGIRAQGHSWTEIDGKAYDPLFAEARSFKDNYAAPYGVYRLRPVLKAQVAIGY